MTTRRTSWATSLPVGAHPGAVQLVALAALGSGVLSTFVVNLGGRGSVGGGFAEEQSTVYGPAHAVLAVALAISGLALVVSSRREAVAPLLGVIGVRSSQLAGVGLVAYRRWPLYWGCCSMKGVTHESLVRDLALLMGLACGATALACLVALANQRCLRWRGWAAAVAFPVALVVVVGISHLMKSYRGGARDLVAAALTYSIPFAAALAVSGLMARLAALVVTVSVAGSALIATSGAPFLDRSLPFHDAQAFAVGAAVVVALVRLVPRRTPAAAV